MLATRPARCRPACSARTGGRSTTVTAPSPSTDAGRSTAAIVHADWCQTGVMVMDGDRPRLRPDGQPDWRFAFFPRAEATLIDTWDTLGLRATGSHDIEVAGLVVPAGHTAMPMFDAACHDGPAVAAVVLDAHLEPHGRVPPRDRAPGPRRADQHGHHQAPGLVARPPSPRTATCRSSWGGPRPGCRRPGPSSLDAVGECWGAVVAGGVPDERQDARVLIATRQAMGPRSTRSTSPSA